MESNSSKVMVEVTSLMRSWEDEHSQPNYNPVPTLTRLAEIIELETENYLKTDPDPFDERHPSRTDPTCNLGQILKALFRKDNFMTKLVNDYLRDTYYSRLNIIGRDVNQLNIAGCRLMLDIMPGLETTVVFQPDMDGLILRLIKWTTDAIEPLQSYATGLLAAAMEIPDIATRFREQNAKLVPLLLQRLKRLQSNSEFIQRSFQPRPFAHLSVKSTEMKSPPLQPVKKLRENGEKNSNHSAVDSEKRLSEGFVSKRTSDFSDASDSEYEHSKKKIKLSESPGKSPSYKATLFAETSNSSWAELESFLIGNIQIFPPTQATRQILILRYLTPMGEYQEFLGLVYEHNALELILSYINVKETKEARLAFEALKYLAALLCHKKFCIEFLNCKGLEALLNVPRPSIAATGVSLCLYYLSYCEEAMERVCLFPKFIVTKLVSYGLWLLECSHDSGRCHATMFFGLTFQFKIILEEFDAQDGLRKLHNVISTLPILSTEENATPQNEDAECAARQIVRHVCVAFKRYLEAHLYAKVEQIRRSQMRTNERIPALPSYKACQSSPDEIQSQIDTLFQYMPFKAHWMPVDQLLKLGGITLLLKIIAFAYEWNYSGRAETVRSALDVLAIACVMPKVQLLFCDRVDLPEETITIGINIILGAADGEIVADADVQKAALRVIVNCVCAPINRVSTSVARFSLGGSTSTCSPSKKKVKGSEELIQKVWESVRSNSGIMVLLQLMNIKTPITDADCIRTLACKALAGLARSDTVKQIVSKLPMFTNGNLQTLMRDPILQEKRQEHVMFQKYALELLERLSGKPKRVGNELDASLIDIHRANVVAQTKIQFNDKQLLQLVHQHLVTKGLLESANILQKEANLANTALLNAIHQPSKFRYTTPTTPTRSRLSICAMASPTVAAIHRSSVQGSEPSSSVQNTSLNGVITTTPTIKIIKKPLSTQSAPPISRLEKQVSIEPHIKIKDHNETISLPEHKITLDSIITEYLTNQHALCKNPMSTCPQFNLFVPHKCPDPKPRMTTARNFAMRTARRQLGYQCITMDRKLIHSRFCPVQVLRLPTDNDFFTCARFMPGEQSVVVGNDSGEIRFFNLHTSNEESMFQAHDSYIDHLEPSRDGALLLSSSTWGKPLSALWSLNSTNLKYSFDSEDYVEFSKTTQDKIIGTKGETATIYDVARGQELHRFVPTITNQYTKNKATFSYNDELVLTDGVLFDVASGKEVHKLDKLNQTQSGIFHPNGFEIISNTEVWDIRTFHLLKTVPSLNQCKVVFAPTNNAVYAIAIEQVLEEDPTFDSSFKTVDASDYSSIATIDVKRNIYDLAVNLVDTQIAIVENQGIYTSVGISESVVRIYDVGRTRDDEEEQDEEDEDDDMGESDDDDDDAHILLDLNTTDDNAENNENNDGTGNGNGNNGNDSSDDSWTSMSGSDSMSDSSGSSGLSAFENILYDDDDDNF